MGGMGWHNLPPPLVEIGLTDLSKPGGEHTPPPPSPGSPMPDMYKYIAQCCGLKICSGEKGGKIGLSLILSYR